MHIYMHVFIHTCIWAFSGYQWHVFPLVFLCTLCLSLEHATRDRPIAVSLWSSLYLGLAIKPSGTGRQAGNPKCKLYASNPYIYMYIYIYALALLLPSWLFQKMPAAQHTLTAIRDQLEMKTTCSTLWLLVKQLV